MSTPIAGRTALENYFGKYYEICQSLKGVSGVVRAFAVHIANYPYIHGFDNIKRETGPYRYIAHYPDDRGVDLILKRVLALLRMHPTTNTLGFTFDKLFELDYSTFCEIEKLVLELLESKSVQADNMNKEFENLLS